MSFDFSERDFSERPASETGGGYDSFGLRAAWGENVVAAVAVALAVLFVTTVAVLMGMG